MCVLMIEFEMSKAASLCLFSLGADCCSLAKCDSSDQSLLFTRHAVHAMTTSPELLSLIASTKPCCLEQMRVCTAASWSVSHQLSWIC